VAPLRLDGHGDVVAERHRAPERGGERRAEGERLVPAGDVGGVEQDAGGGVDAARRADADPG
jgi:hypothetical protein